MAEEKFKIGCPMCGAVLAVKMMDGIENMAITCPVCKNKRKFTDYRKIKESEETTVKGTDNHENKVVGELVGTDIGFRASLKKGRNVIGRKGSGSEATVQIPAPSKRMSREHLVIDVKTVEGLGIVHYASLYKEIVNPTYIGKNLLEYGDSVILNDGDIIKLPDIDIKFEIPDEEKTDYEEL